MMREEKLSWLEQKIMQGFDAALAEIEQNDSESEEQNLSDLEQRLKKRKENSSSHKRVEELKKITQNK